MMGPSSGIRPGHGEGVGQLEEASEAEALRRSSGIVVRDALSHVVTDVPRGPAYSTLEGEAAKIVEGIDEVPP